MVNSIYISLIGFGVSYFIFSIVIFFITGKQIIGKIKVMIGKSKDKAVVIELKNNRSLREHISTLNGDTLQLGDKYYNISPNHIFISDNYGCKAVVISENLKKSINPKELNQSGLDMKTISTLIQRAKSVGKQEALEFIQKITKLAPLVIMGVGLAMVIQLFMLYQILTTINGGRIL